MTVEVRASLILRCSCVCVCVTLTMTAPVLDVHPPALLLRCCVTSAGLLLCVQLGVDSRHRRRVQRDVAELRRPAQAEHGVAQRRPERVQVPRRVAGRRADPEQLEARLHPRQHD